MPKTSKNIKTIFGSKNKKKPTKNIKKHQIVSFIFGIFVVIFLIIGGLTMLINNQIKNSETASADELSKPSLLNFSEDNSILPLSPADLEIFQEKTPTSDQAESSGMSVLVSPTKELTDEDWKELQKKYNFDSFEELLPIGYSLEFSQGVDFDYIKKQIELDPLLDLAAPKEPVDVPIPPTVIAIDPKENPNSDPNFPEYLPDGPVVPFNDTAVTSDGQQYVAGQAIVKFKTELTDENWQTLKNKYVIQSKTELGLNNTYVLYTDKTVDMENLIKVMSKEPTIEFIELNYIISIGSYPDLKDYPEDPIKEIKIPDEPQLLPEDQIGFPSDPGFPELNISSSSSSSTTSNLRNFDPEKNMLIIKEDEISFFPKPSESKIIGDDDLTFIVNGSSLAPENEDWQKYVIPDLDQNDYCEIKIKEYAKDGNDPNGGFEALFNSLQGPVDFIAVDKNNNGVPDTMRVPYDSTIGCLVTLPKEKQTTAKYDFEVRVYQLDSNNQVFRVFANNYTYAMKWGAFPFLKVRFQSLP